MTPRPEGRLESGCSCSVVSNATTRARAGHHTKDTEYSVGATTPIVWHAVDDNSNENTCAT